MEQGLKERLIGAAVLVVLAVWLIPWLLDGPDEVAEDGPVSLQLPVPPEQPVGQVRTETIDLRPPRETDSPVISADDSAVGRRADIRAAPSSSVSTPPSRGSLESGEPSAAGPADLEPSSITQTTNDRVAAAGANSGVVPGEREAAPPAEDDESAAAPATAAAAQNAVESATPVQSTPSAPPPRPAVAAASPAQPAATGDWALQLGSFGDESNARRLADRVSSFGYTPQITNYRAGGRTMYRVRIGPHETRARAEAAASALSAHGFVAQVVTAD